MMFANLIEKLRHQEDLTTEEAAGAMAAIMRGEATPAQTAGLLIGLSMKGERPSELVGFARVPTLEVENDRRGRKRIQRILKRRD